MEHYGDLISPTTDARAGAVRSRPPRVRRRTGSPYTLQFLPFVFVMDILVAFNWLAFTIIATHCAATGQLLSYPMSLRRLGLGGAARRPPPV